MTKKPTRICETCADQYLPFQVRDQTLTVLTICDTCNLFAKTERIRDLGNHPLFVPPFLRDYEKILNELEMAYMHATSEQQFELAEDIATMIEKFECEQIEANDES